MTETPPPLPPFEEDDYLTAEPAITFKIQRIVVARRNEIFRAWTDPETFKRWIVPPDQELVSFSFDPNGEATWKAKTHANAECVEYALGRATHFPYRMFESACYTPAVPGMVDEHPVHLLLTLKKIEREGKILCTRLGLQLSYHHATLWRYTSRVDLHTFWLEATERLTRLVEQNSILRETAD